MHDLSNFRLPDTILASRELRDLGRNASTMEEAARNVVNFLYECFRTPQTGDPCWALVRCFITHRFTLLPADLRAIAASLMADKPITSDLCCLILLASRGDDPAWNSRHTSKDHQAIPLPTEEIVAQAPMIARLVHQMGMDVGQVIQPCRDLLVDLEQHTFNVFHVEDAVGSEYIPAQQTFVARYGVKSALGFGGVLPSGELFAVIMFAKVKINRETAELFKTLALSVKLALLPFAGDRIFENE